MRVATATLYKQTKENIGRKNRGMLEKNSVISSGKRIQKLSDDPVDASRVTSLKTTMDDLTQLQRNVDTGTLWLEGSEASLVRVKEMVDRAKQIAISMVNGAANADDMQTASLEVSALIKGVIDQSNARVNGQYIFSGTRSDTRPFMADDKESPKAVTYRGNAHPFHVKIGPKSEMKVGFSGEDIFSSDVVIIDETSNKLDFTEKKAGDPLGQEKVLKAVVDNGTYSRQGLAHAVEMAMERASAKGGEKVDYRVSWNDAEEAFSIAEEEGPAPSKLSRLCVLFRTGEARKESVGAFMGFAANDIATEPSRSPMVSERGVQWGVFNSLFDLRNSLAINDQEALHQSISRLSADHNNLISNISEAGVRANRLDARKSLLSDLTISHDANRSRLEDADVIKAISDLRLKQFGYESSLASSSRILNTSLLNYLK